MSAVRILRWIVLLSAFAASVTWSYIAIDHLLSSSLNQKQRASRYGTSVQPQADATKQLEQSQMKWGRQSLFSVAFSFFMLLAVLMNWVLDGRRPRVLKR